MGIGLFRTCNTNRFFARPRAAAVHGCLAEKTSGAPVAEPRRVGEHQGPYGVSRKDGGTYQTLPNQRSDL
jgi:hypothetical protein